MRDFSAATPSPINPESPDHLGDGQGLLMEAAGVEPASANGSYRASTCVASLSISPGAASEQPTPKLATLNISSLARAAPASDQPDSSTFRRPASGRQIRKRTTNRSYAANAISLLAIKVSPEVLRGPRNLGTLLHVHQARRSRDAPDVLPAYSRLGCKISVLDRNYPPE